MLHSVASIVAGFRRFPLAPREYEQHARNMAKREGGGLISGRFQPESDHHPSLERKPQFLLFVRPLTRAGARPLLVTSNRRESKSG
jgi:hypothetical protein